MSTGSGSPYGGRLESLRRELARRRLDGFIVPLSDEHLSEYVGEYAQRLAWLTGFQGSAGATVVLPTQAVMFVDGRYTLQVREQVDERHWRFQQVPHTNVAQWLSRNAPTGARIGCDPWLHSRRWTAEARATLLERGVQLVAVDSNPVDAVWADRPAPSLAKLRVHPEQFAGRSAAEKRREIVEWLQATKADAVVLTALDSVAWAFNIRGSDILHTPLALAFAVVHVDGTAALFVSPEKLTPEVIDHLGDSVKLHPREAFPDYLAKLGDQRVALDPERAVAAFFEILTSAGARIIEARDPVVLSKAIKNPIEIAGHKAAQARDGAALTAFLHWLSIQGAKGTVTELSAAARLRQFREATGELRDLAFDTISGYGPNGAIVHYFPTPRTDRRIVPDSLYLIDSGGQYLDGTTDVTRTVAIGEPTAEMRDRFTRVLKGHIALASARFPVGTRGGQLDALARQHLWAAGFDYAHGTSHGVGSYLCIHEGPQRISHTPGCDEPLVPGMILSNEPGYYKAGEYGIRIESLVLVVEIEVIGGEQQMLGFETLTFAPIDRTLIDLQMLTVQERDWVDAYHERTLQVIGPRLQGDAKSWLMQVTRPLGEA